MMNDIKFRLNYTISEPRWLSRYCDELRAERSGFDFRQGQEMFYYLAASRPALGPTQHPMQWVPGPLPRE
jgi:hypothetical protein